MNTACKVYLIVSAIINAWCWESWRLMTGVSQLSLRRKTENKGGTSTAINMSYYADLFSQPFTPMRSICITHHFHDLFLLLLPIKFHE